jgi:hypothetical protein
MNIDEHDDSLHTTDESTQQVLDFDNRRDTVRVTGILPRRIPQSIPQPLGEPPVPMTDLELLARVRDGLRSLDTTRERPSPMNGPLLETTTGHRCDTWNRQHGSAGKECAHGYVLWAHEISIARLRAERVHQSDSEGDL